MTELQAQLKTIARMSVPTEHISDEDHFERRNAATALRAGFEEEPEFTEFRGPLEPVRTGRSSPWAPPSSVRASTSVCS